MGPRTGDAPRGRASDARACGEAVWAALARGRGGRGGQELGGAVSSKAADLLILFSMMALLCAVATLLKTRLFSRGVS